MTVPYVLLDMRGLALRALHSGLDSEGCKLDGVQVNSMGFALDNFLRDFLPLTKDFRLNHIIAVWEGGNQLRQDLITAYNATVPAEQRLPGYKDRRKETHPDVTSARNQFCALVTEVFKRLGIVQVRVPFLEADDVIAWLATQLKNDSVLIVTVDLDLSALATPDRRVSVQVNHEFVTHFKEHHLCLVPLYKTLVGDPADGYGGLKGFGAAAFDKLVEQYGLGGCLTLSDIVESGDLDALRKGVAQEPGQHKLLERIVSDWPRVRLMWQLASLHPEMVNHKYLKSGQFLTPQWTKRLPDADKLHKTLSEFDCLNHWAAIAPLMPKRWIYDAKEFNWESDLAEAAAAFAVSPLVAVDWETFAPHHAPFKEAANGRKHVDMMSSQLVGAGFTFGRNLEYTFYATVAHRDSDNLPVEFISELIKAVPAEIPLVAHNSYFEAVVYCNTFKTEFPVAEDTQIMASHVDEHSSHGLKDLAKVWLGYEQARYEDVIAADKNMADYSADEVFSYGADDPFVTAHLYDLFKLILKLEGSWEFVKACEFPAIPLFVDAHVAGVSADYGALARLQAEDKQIYDQSIARLRELVAKHQTEARLLAGIENLKLDTQLELEAKAEAESWSAELLGEKVADAFARVEERATYKPYREVEQEIKFSPTLKQINEVLVWLDLPELADDKRDTVVDWLLRREQEKLNKAQRAFCTHFAEVSTILRKTSDRNTEVGQQFIARCLEVKRSKLPRDARFKRTGTEFNLNSPDQVSALLYGMLVLPPRCRNFKVSKKRQHLKLTEGSVQSDESAILSALANDAPPGSWEREALEALLAAKKADTRRKMFYRPYPLWKHPVTGLIHPGLNSVGTATRRPTGSAPNLLQLPKKEEGLKVREVILPNANMGHDLIVSIDFSQEELRFAAGLSFDMEMLSCFINRDVLQTLPQWMLDLLGTERVQRLAQVDALRDMHSLTGSGILGVSYDEFELARQNKEHPLHAKAVKTRKEAKTVNFLSQYGGGAGKLSRKLLQPVDVARTYLQAKSAKYHQYEAWKQGSTAEFNAKGVLRTLYGSYRHGYKQVFVADEGLRSHYERAAVNSRIQGACADFLKKVLADLYHQRTLRRHDAVLVCPIYDELVFSCFSGKAIPLILEVHKTMTQPVPGLPCPIVAEPSLGPNFGVQIEIGPEPTPEKIQAAIDEALGLNKPTH